MYAKVKTRSGTHGVQVSPFAQTALDIQAPPSDDPSKNEYIDSLKVLLGAAITLIENEIKENNDTDETKYTKPLMNELFLNKDNKLKPTFSIDATMSDLRHFSEALSLLKGIFHAGEYVYRNKDACSNSK